MGIKEVAVTGVAVSAFAVLTFVNPAEFVLEPREVDELADVPLLLRALVSAALTGLLCPKLALLVPVQVAAGLAELPEGVSAQLAEAIVFAITVVLCSAANASAGAPAISASKAPAIRKAPTPGPSAPAAELEFVAEESDQEEEEEEEGQPEALSPLPTKQRQQQAAPTYAAEEEESDSDAVDDVSDPDAPGMDDMEVDEEVASAKEVPAAPAVQSPVTPVKAASRSNTPASSAKRATKSKSPGGVSMTVAEARALAAAEQQQRVQERIAAMRRKK